MDPDLRRKVIAEWRGLPEPYKPPERVQSVADLIPKWLKTLGLSERLTEERIRSTWLEIAGDFIAAHSSPVRLRTGILYVQVIQPTVRFELERNLKPHLVRRLRERFGNAIRDVKFTLS